MLVRRAKKRGEVRGQRQVMQSRSSSHFGRCDALLQCITGPFNISKKYAALSVSYIRAVREEISRTQRAIKLEESRVGTRLFHFSV